MSSKILLVASLVAVLFTLSGCPSPGGGDENTGTKVTQVGDKEKDISEEVSVTDELSPDECPVCSTPLFLSSTLVKDGKAYRQGGEPNFVSLPCWVEYADIEGLDILDAWTINYGSGDGTGEYMPISDAFYVQVEVLPGSQPPYFAAFSSEEEAGAFAQKENGTTASFEEALERTRDFIGQTGGHEAHDHDRELSATSCPICGMDSAKSPTLVEGAGKSFDSLGDWIRYARNEGLDAADAEILDHPTFEAEKSLISLEDAHFVQVYAMRFAMPPFIAAFSESEDAQKLAAAEGTQVMTFEEALEVVNTAIGESKEDQDGEQPEDGHEGHGH